MIFYIYGAGGLGREIFDVATRQNAVTSAWEKIIFVDDFAPPGLFYGTELIDFEALLALGPRVEGVIAVGEPAAREKLYIKLKENNIPLATFIDPTAIISPTAKLAKGVVVMEHVTVKANVCVGDNTLLQPCSVIGHDIAIGTHSVLSAFSAPGGCSTFGNCVFVGMSASILEGVAVGDGAIIGMGAVVFRDVSAGTTVLGNPARETKGNDSRRVFR